MQGQLSIAEDRPGTRAQSRPRNLPVVLLVSRRDDQRDLLSAYLATHSVEVVPCSNIDAVDAKAQLSVADVVILDASLPDDAIATLRRFPGRVPPFILVISETDDVVERVLALERGADDLVSRDCHPRELLARIRCLIRRREHRVDESAGDSLDAAGPWTLNERSRRLLSPAGAVHQLSKYDFEIMNMFMSEPGGVVTEEIMADRFGTEPRFAGNNLRTAVSRLKRRFQRTHGEELPIRNVRGLGYALEAKVLRSAARVI